MMAFTDQQKIDIRRHLGYPVFGAVPTQGFGYRFYQHYQTLEFRMNNLGSDEESTVIATYLADCNTLEAQIAPSGANLDTDKAAVWTHNKDEVRDRVKLYDYRRSQLGQFFGVPVRNNNMTTGISFVV